MLVCCLHEIGDGGLQNPPCEIGKMCLCSRRLILSDFQEQFSNKEISICKIFGITVLCVQFVLLILPTVHSKTCF